MISKELIAAREYEARESIKVSEEERPIYHFTPLIGWLNDPNGLSYYGGQFHMFYQYHPYDSHWGPMHWGHAVSSDLIRWEYLPAALAPDTAYDKSGCFSGTAMVMEDGSHLLMYTSCGDSKDDPTGKGRWIQSQSIAVKPADVEEYIKYEGNPVITSADLPKGGDAYEFRDPFMWRTADGSLRVLVANGRTDAGDGTQLTMYRSSDGFHWGDGKVFFEDGRKIGVMWECPNFFSLDGVHVLIASPMDMQAEEEEANGSIRFPQGNNVCYITGKYNAYAEEFLPDMDVDGSYRYEPVDLGLDFYAPQVMKTSDGRTILIGWMQDPKMGNLHQADDYKIFGQMTVPRELSLRGRKLYQWPVSELEEYRSELVEYDGFAPGDVWTSLPGVRGRAIDLSLEVMASEPGSSFAVRFAASDELYTEIRYDHDKSVITIDRSNSGQPEYMTRSRKNKVNTKEGKLDLRILLDRWSAEVFINGGEQVISATYYTDLSADEIFFRSSGDVSVDVKKYDIIINN